MSMVNNIAVDGKDVKMISNLYKKQKAAMRMEYEKNKLDRDTQGSETGMCTLI